MEFGFKDREEVQGGDALPYDFSAVQYSYLHQKPAEKHKEPGNQLFSPFRNVGSSVLNSKKPQIDEDISLIKGMRSNIKETHREEDKINQHITKVKSQPYFGQIYDPYEAGVNPFD